jgi:hypothetical protein
MAGGLIQIASYGIHDIFLIGNPQITFFKIVYRRHTNFAMEYVNESFIGTQNFGNYLSCNLSKVGDLLHKLYIKIDIPQVAISKLTYGVPEINSIDPSYVPYDEYLKNYNSLINFINKLNFSLIQPLYMLTKINGIKYNDIKNKYNITYNKMNYVNSLNAISNIMWSFNETFALPLNNGNTNQIPIKTQTTVSDFLDFNTYYNLYIKSTTTTIITDLTTLLDKFMLQLNIIKKKMNTQLQLLKKLYDTLNRSNINFSWVEFIGHQIINKVEIELGGKVIDFTDAVRMNINYQLTNNIGHDETYNKIIGNIPELTTYNSDTKQSYTLYIPIDFWFSKYSGLSIPLIYLRFHDVKINLQLNDLVNCCYYEKLKDDTYIEDLINLDSVSLIANYIYLDSDERKKFAQLSHEYLIDQTQIATYTNLTTQIINVELPYFNLIKQLFWVIRDKNNIDRLKYFDYGNNFYIDIYSFESVGDNIEPSQKQKYIKIRTTNINVGNFIKIGDTITINNSIYYSGDYVVQKIIDEYIYVYFDFYIKENYLLNYSVDNNNGIITYTKNLAYQGNSQAFIIKKNNSNPFEFSTLELNGIQRFYKTDGIYNNYTQSYQNNSRSPSYGLNTYSFALHPEEYQPCGFCNFNALDLKSMTFYLDKTYQNKELKKNLIMTVYAHGYNILKFAYGKAGLILNI